MPMTWTGHPIAGDRLNGVGIESMRASPVNQYAANRKRGSKFQVRPRRNARELGRRHPYSSAVKRVASDELAVNWPQFGPTLLAA